MTLREAAEAVEKSRRPAVGCENHELVASEDLEALREAVAAGHRSVTPEQIAAIGRARTVIHAVTDMMRCGADEHGWDRQAIEVTTQWIVPVSEALLAMSAGDLASLAAIVGG